MDENKIKKQIIEQYLKNLELKKQIDETQKQIDKYKKEISESKKIINQIKK